MHFQAWTEIPKPAIRPAERAEIDAAVRGMVTKDIGVTRFRDDDHVVGDPKVD